MTATRAKMSEALSEVVTSFTREAMVRGYHIYNSIWEAYIGEELSWPLESLKMVFSVKEGRL